MPRSARSAPILRPRPGARKSSSSPPVSCLRSPCESLHQPCVTQVGKMVCDAYLICTARVALVPSQVATLTKAPLFSCSILMVAAFLPMIRPAFECSHSRTIVESSVAHSFFCWLSSPSASNDSPPRSLFPPTSAAGGTCVQFRCCSNLFPAPRKIPAQRGMSAGGGAQGRGKWEYQGRGGG